MAAGFTLENDKADAFLAFVDSALRDQVLHASTQAELKIDGALIASATTVELMTLLERAGPYGAGNPQPRFAFPSHRCKFTKVVGDNHVRCSLVSGDGKRIDAISFKAADTALGKMLLESSGMPLHLTGSLRLNEWGGRTKVELHIDDAADPRG